MLRRGLATITMVGGAILAGACSAPVATEGSASTESEALAQCGVFEDIDDCEPEGPRGQLICTCAPVPLAPLESLPDGQTCGTPNLLAHPTGLFGCTPGTTLHGIQFGARVSANVWVCPDSLQSKAQSLGYIVAPNSHGFEDPCWGPTPDGYFYAVLFTGYEFLDGGAPGTGCSGPCNLVPP